MDLHALRHHLGRCLNTTAVVVEDESHAHVGHREVQNRSRGHSVSNPGHPTHLRVHIISEVFTGLSRLQRHRLVYRALEAAFERGLHAVVIEARTPGELGSFPVS